MEKLAVVLFNLGGPAKSADIEPFLFNFFMDRNIVDLPKFFRFLLAKRISISRGRGAARDSYGQLGGGSPILENTRQQAKALETALQEKHPGARTFVSMRYWHPMSDDVARDVAAFAPDKIILLPLYPQFSTTTVFSSLQDWRRAATAAGLKAPTTEICCYPDHPSFIDASAELIAAALQRAPRKARVLFSAHGLPKKVIAKGDPYQWQVEETARRIVEKMNVPQLDWQVCYQSKVGPLSWTEPSLEDALAQAADDKTGVLVYPVAFVSEHVETLVELDIEYRERAAHMGIPYYARVPAVSTHPAFINGLRDLVLEKLAVPACGRICPTPFKRCYQEKKHG